MQSSRLTFDFVIQADLESLVAVCLALPKAESTDQQMSLTYGQAIIHFLRGENEMLSEMIARLPETLAGNAELSEVALACQLRLQIRFRKFDPSLLDSAKQFIDRIESAESAGSARKWRGEIAMLLATAATISDDYQGAMDLFAIAAQALLDGGFFRKSLRAQMNMLVCDSHIQPGKNLFTRYHDLYRQAIKRDRREIIVATTCLLNISREYQRAGAFLVALKYCSRALVLFERQMGDMNYYLALVHRAQLLCVLGRLAEARIDVDSASLAPFKEVHAALEVVRPLIEGQLPTTPTTINMNDLLPTWKERLTEMKTQESRPKLSALEERLISILSRGARERIDLVDEIYGDRLDAETKQNRFKSLVGTFRKKCPELIVYDQGRYRLADQMLVSQNPRVS